VGYELAGGDSLRDLLPRDFSMQLALKSEAVGEALIVRCRGRIVTGEEAHFLQSELDKLTQAHLTRNVVLNLAEVNYLDSGGLGTLVRMLGRLRSARGDLKVCQPPPFVLRVLQLTNLLNVFPPYSSEREAVEAFSQRPQTLHGMPGTTSDRIVCLDSSLELLAYVRLLLQRDGYEVFTTQYLSDALTIAKVRQASLVIVGPDTPNKEAAIEKLRQNVPSTRLLHLPADFSTSDADHAGPNLVNQVRSLLVR
jgi:anti-anti-sigma factor